jgi:hypothetical protein
LKRSYHCGYAPSERKDTEYYEIWDRGNHATEYDEIWDRGKNILGLGPRKVIML